jgi:peptidyl-tRNA hydrolase, PTH1 family
MNVSSDRWLVFGLGNPASEYGLTRHNIGQMVIEYLATSGFTQKNRLSAHKSKSDACEINIAGQKVVIGQSQGYMNLSGVPAKALADFYKISAKQLIVIHDEIDLPFNAMRIKLGGGDNGHNGLKSVTSHFGADYYRIRMGVGRPPAPQDPADFVLRKFSHLEQKELPGFIIRATQSIETLISRGLETAQQEFNN